jgi:hypothetical protein
VRAIAPRQAASLVEARLDRPAQDALEAAVVLEAWGGVRPSTALPLGDHVVREPSQARQRHGSGHDEPPEPWRLSEHVATLVALVALIAWSRPLIAAVGHDVFEQTWRLAIPLTLAIQWALRRRYLAGPEGLGRLRCAAPWLVVVAAVVPGVMAAVAGLAGGLAGLLVVVWLVAAIAGRRGWWLVYGALLAGTAGGFWAGWPVLPTMIGTALGSVGVAAAALWRVAPSNARPGPWSQVLLACALGGTLGTILVVDGSVRWGADGLFPALALLPSIAGGLHGSAHLNGLWVELPASLRVTPAQSAPSGLSSRRAASVISGAVIRLALTTVVLSVLISAGPWSDRLPRLLLVWILVGFGVVTLAALAITLHDAFGRSSWALGAAVTGLAGELSLRTQGPTAAGSGLLLAGVIAVAILLPPTVALVRDPARTLATFVNVR